MSLSELSREMPTEGQLQYFPEILAQEQSERARVIMAAGLVEQALFVAVCSRIADPGATIIKSWFEDANAPFNTFSSKIVLGRALAIYAEKSERRLVIIKNIRNVFAHRSIPVDFSHPTVRNQALKLATRPSQSDPERAYLAACLAMAKKLIEDSMKHGGKELEIGFL